MHKYAKWAVVLGIIVAVVLIIDPFKEKQVQDTVVTQQENQDYYSRYLDAKQAGIPVFIEFYGRY